MWNSQQKENIVTLLFFIGLIIIFVAFIVKIASEESHQYKIHIGFSSYYCNAYELEDSRLVLKDCSKRDRIIIYNPTDFTVRE